MTRERGSRRRPGSAKKAGPVYESSHREGTRTPREGTRTRDRNNRDFDNINGNTNQPKSRERPKSAKDKSKERPQSGKDKNRDLSTRGRVTVKDVLSEKGGPNAKKMYIVQIPRKALNPERIKEAIRAHELSRSMTALSVSSDTHLPNPNPTSVPNQTKRRLRKWRPKSASSVRPDAEAASEEKMQPNGADSRKWRSSRYSRFKYPQHMHYREVPNTPTLESRVPYCMRQFPKYTRLPLKQSCGYAPWGSVSYSCRHSVGSVHLPHPRAGQTIKLDRPMSAPPSMQCTARTEAAAMPNDAMGSNSVIGLADDDDDYEESPYHTAYEDLAPTVIVEENDDDDDNGNTLQAINGYQEEEDAGNYSDDNFDTGRDSEDHSGDNPDSRRSSIQSPGDAGSRRSSASGSSRPQSGRPSSGRRGSDSELSPRPQSARRGSNSSSPGRPQSGRRSTGPSSRPHSARRFSNSSEGASRPQSARRNSDHSGPEQRDRRDSHSSSSHFSPRTFSDNEDIPEEDENGDTARRNKPEPDHYDPYEQASEVEDD